MSAHCSNNNVVDASVATIVQETRGYFSGSGSTNPDSFNDGGNKKEWFEFEKGGFGIACRIVERRPGRPPRRLAVKRALGKDEEASLRREIRVLKRLRGAEHIVRHVASRTGGNGDEDDDDSAAANGGNTGGLVRRLSDLFRGSGSSHRRPSRDDPSGDFLAGLTGPVLVMEYLEHQDLSLLLSRVQEEKITLPNRILWAFFLCMVRACVALAYPPDADEETPNRLETIPKGRRPENLAHGDLHIRNIMISDLGGGFREHALVPALKFIDFGQATKVKQIAYSNLLEVSKAIVALIIHSPRTFNNLNPANYGGIITGARQILPAPWGSGDAYTTLDPALRDFLARCLAISPRDRPSLAEMLSTTEAAARKPASEYGSFEHLESDRAISKIVRALIFDADS